MLFSLMQAHILGLVSVLVLTPLSWHRSHLSGWFCRFPLPREGHQGGEVDSHLISWFIKMFLPHRFYSACMGQVLACSDSWATASRQSSQICSVCDGISSSLIFQYWWCMVFYHMLLYCFCNLSFIHIGSYYWLLTYYFISTILRSVSFFFFLACWN